LSLSGFESEAEMTSDVYAYEIATSPIVANAYRALGLCERDTKDFTEAKKLYKRALQVFLATGLTEKDHECVETQRLIDEVAILVYEEKKKAEKKLKIKLIDWMVCKKKADEPEPTGDPKTCPCKSCTARREIAEEERRRREAEEAQRSKEETEARQAKAIARKKYKKNMKEAKRWASAHTFKVGDLCQWDEEEDEDIPAGLLGTVEAVDEENREIDVRFPNGDVFTLEAPDLIYVAKTWENFYSKDHNPVFVRIHDWATKAVASIPDNR
jgi:tetratricopeptide (TPR) repeat protein